MARRKVMRSWLAATLLSLSGAAGIFVAAPPIGAAAAPECVPERTVTVYETEFKPASVWAKKQEFICFVLGPGVGMHHTVTLESDDCNTRFTSLCEQRFDDPPRASLAFRFSEYNEYSYFDRYVRDEHRPDMKGLMVVSPADQTVPPATSPTSTSSTTTTTAPASTPTTAGPTTTTTAPTSIRPMLVPDPAPTTTTTRAANPAATPTPAPASKSNDKDKAKKASSPSTPTTVAPAPDGTMPPDSVFDPAALTPAPTLVPAPDGSNGDEAAIDAAAAASLLDQQKDNDDGSKLLLLAFGALALMLMVGGGWAWFTRASRYDPA